MNKPDITTSDDRQSRIPLVSFQPSRRAIVQRLVTLPCRRSLEVILGVLCCGTVAAQTYPTRPVRVIVTFPAGAGTDISARLVTVKLSEALGQQFIVDNRAGAAGNIGVELAARAAPDGYTLLTVTAAAAVSQSLLAKAPFDLIRDFAPVGMLASAPLVLAVHPNVPAKSLADLIALAKAKPGAISFATPGTGSSPHLAGELLKLQAGIEMLHVPYKGVVPAATDVVAGNVPVILGNTLVVLPHVRSARLRGLAVTSAKRSAVASDLPTIAESGFPGFESVTWYGFMAPARTTADIIGRLNPAMTRALQLPDVREKLLALGAEPMPTTSEQMGSFVRDEIAKWARVVKAAGLRAQGS